MKKIIAVLTIILLSVALTFAADDDFSKLDKNKDGKISKQEYLDAMAATFDSLDKNKDGLLTRDELKLIEKIEAKEFLKEADTNKDGKITRQEFMQAVKKRLNRADNNKDGYVDNNEWGAKRSPARTLFILFTF